MAQLHGASTHYDLAPGVESLPGDIYRGVHWLGLGGRLRVSAITVSPACDLAQCKTEAVTLLPVLSVRDYFASALAIVDTRTRMDGLLRNSKLGPLGNEENPHFLPDREECTSVLAAAKLRVSAEKSPQGRDELQAIQDGLEFFLSLAATGVGSFEKWKSLMGRRRSEELVTKSVLNQLGWTHHLPADGHTAALTALPEASVALLRHPFTIPLELLDVASAEHQLDWNDLCKMRAAAYPVAKILAAEKPLKVARLRDEYLKDLLSRFTGLFGRLGAPDLDRSYVQAATAAVLS